MLKKILILFTAFYSLAIFASNGWVSSGGDNIPGNVGASWFLGDEAITYCLDSSADFSVSDQKLNSIIQHSVNTWKEYYDQHRSFITNQSFHPNFNFLLKENCDDSVDVKFSFGIDSPEIDKLKKTFYNPFGFSTLLSYDSKIGRGHGIIWIGDPKKLYPDADPIGLNAMILHELGHVFGNGHVPFTIMDEKIAEAITATGPQVGLQINDPNIVKLFTHINGKNQLFFNYASLFNISGYVPLNKNNSNILQAQEYILSQFFGRKIKGIVLANFENLGPWVNYVLHLKDDLGSVDIKIPGNGDGTSITTKSELFKTFTYDPISNTQQITFESSRAWTFYSSFITPNNEVMPMTINLYTDDYNPVQIRFFYQGQFIQLFKNGSPELYGSHR